MDDTARILTTQNAWLQALARSLVADADLAQDVAQETMVVAWRRRLHGIADPRAWLATVARRMATRLVRNRRRQEIRDASAPMAEPAPATADVVATATAQRDVVDAVLALAEPLRTTMLLRYQQDLGYEDLAARLRVSVETIRSRIKRGLREVRAELDRRHFDHKAWAVPILGVTGFQAAVARATPRLVARATGGAAATAGVLTMTNGKIGVAVVGGLLAIWVGQAVWSGTATAGPKPGDLVPVVATGAGSAPDASAPERSLAGAPVAVATRAVPGAAAVTVCGRIVDEVTGGGVGGATVTLLRCPDPWQTLHQPLATAVTAGDGAFALALAAEALLAEPAILVQADGHAPLFSTVARVAEPEGRQRRDLGELSLAVGRTLAGRVVDAAGQPVGHARLLLLRQCDPFAISVLARAEVVASADADGRFVLPGRYASDRHPQWLLAVGPRSFGWRQIAVSRLAGAETGFDVTLAATTSLTVRVMDPAGRPRRDVEVAVHPRFAPLTSPADVFVPMEPAEPFVPLLRARTGADGCAVLPCLPLGEPGGLLLPDRAAGAYRLVVTAAAARRVERDVTLSPAGVEETVVIADGERLRCAGVVVDGQDRPIADATVRIDGVEVARTGARGTFEAAGVDARRGRWRVEVVAAGFAVAQQAHDVSAVVGVLTTRVALQRQQRLTGVVVGPAGDPVADVAVMCPRGVCTTGPDGRFGFTLSEGESVLVSVFTRDPRWQAPLPGLLSAGEHRLVLARAPECLAEVELRLADRDTGRRLEPARVLVWKRTMATFAAPVLAGGSIRLPRLAAGDWTVAVATRSGHRTVRSLRVPPGVPRLVEDWQIAPPARLTVRVQGVESGVALAVRAFRPGPDGPADGGWLELSESGDVPVVDGVAQLPGIEPGSPVTVVVAGAGRIGWLATPVDRAGEHEVVVVLRPAGRVRLRAAAAGVQEVVCTNADGPPLPHVFGAGNDGVVEGWLPVGLWQVRGRASSESEFGVVRTGTVTVAEGALSELELR